MNLQFQHALSKPTELMFIWHADQVCSHCTNVKPIDFVHACSLGSLGQLLLTKASKTKATFCPEKYLFQMFLSARTAKSYHAMHQLISDVQ